jgi:hypothetical protein
MPEISTVGAGATPKDLKKLITLWRMDTARRRLALDCLAADYAPTAAAILPKSTKFGIFHRQWTSQLPRIGFATFV